MRRFGGFRRETAVAADGHADDQGLGGRRLSPSMNRKLTLSFRGWRSRKESPPPPGAEAHTTEKVVLHRKGLNTKYGFRVEPQGKRKSLYIRSISKGGIADQSGQLWVGQRIVSINKLLCERITATRIRRLMTAGTKLVLEVESRYKDRGPHLADLPLAYIFANFGLTPVDLARLSAVCKRLWTAAHEVKTLYDKAMAMIDDGKIDLMAALNQKMWSPWFPVVKHDSGAPVAWSHLPMAVLVGAGATEEWATESVVAVAGVEEDVPEVKEIKEHTGDTIRIFLPSVVHRAWFGDPKYKWDKEHGTDVTALATTLIEDGRALTADVEAWGDPKVGTVKVLLVEYSRNQPHSSIALAVKSGCRFRTVSLQSSAVTDLTPYVHTEELDLRESDNITDVTPLKDSQIRTLHLTFCPELVDVSALSAVQHLDLTGCEALENVSPLGKVHWLCLARCPKVTDVSALGGVHTLNLSHCVAVVDVNALGTCHTVLLAGCTKLHDVSALGKVHELDISDTAVADISALGHVHTLRVSGTQVADVAALGSVTCLDLSYCPNVTDVAFLGGVASLDIRGTSVTSVAALTEVADLTWSAPRPSHTAVVDPVGDDIVRPPPKPAVPIEGEE